MTKTFCDRCGKEINMHEYSWLRRRIIYVEARLIMYKNRPDFKDDDKYICPDCSDEYIHWFMQGQKGQGNGDH